MIFLILAALCVLFMVGCIFGDSWDAREDARQRNRVR